MERLFELLREDAPLPPSEVDVDKAMAAGRRRVRGRWIGAAAVVVVVVSVVSVVGSIVGSSVETATTPVRDFDPLRRVITVDESVASIRNYETARRWQQVLLGSTRTHETGLLTVYAPGRQLTDRYGPVRPESGTKAPPVHGRPAYWVNRQSDVSLAWQWADGAWALINIDDMPTGSPDKDAMRRFAAAVRVTAGEPVTAPFTMPRLAHAKFIGTHAGVVPAAWLGDPSSQMIPGPPELSFGTDDPTHPDTTTYPDLTADPVVRGTRTSVGLSYGTNSNNPGDQTVDGHPATFGQGELVVWNVADHFDIHVTGPEDTDGLIAIARTVRVLPTPTDKSTWTTEPLV